MRPLPLILPLLLSIASKTGGNERLTLNQWIDPLTIDTVRDGDLWDFSRAEGMLDGLGARYKISGDTLLSETVDNHRRWYSLHGDTVRLVREESYGYSSVPDSDVITSAFPNGNRILTYPYHSKGEEGHTRLPVRDGVYTSCPPVAGKMKIPIGDTIDVTVTVERCDYIKSIPHHPGSDYETLTDEVPTTDGPAGDRPDVRDSVARVSYLRYRWFAGSVLPIAVQTRVKSMTEDGTVLSCDSTAYTVDFNSDIRARLKSRQSDNLSGTENPLENLTVGIESDNIIVKLDAGDFPGSLELEIDVMSSGGIPYYRRIHEYSGQALEIPCSSFPSGRYIIGVRYREFIEKRMMVKD